MTPKPSPLEFSEPFYASLIELSRRRTDWKKYVELLEVAARAGDDQASYALSSMCLHRSTQPKWRLDVPRGVRLLRRAARSVHLAMTELAMCHESGDFGVRRSERKAFELFTRAVEFGSVVARYHLGRCLYYGVGTPVNRRKAAALFREAAKLGFPVYEDHGSDPAGL